MSEILEQPLPGDIRYYRLQGPVMQRSDGLERVHDELQGVGVSIWDGEHETAKVGNSKEDALLKGEIAMLVELEESHISRLHNIGAEVLEIDPDTSHLHWEHTHQAA